MEAVESNEDEATGADGAPNAAAREQRKSRLNNAVAVTVALLATFMGICGVKDDNIVQAMQQAQADKIDNYAWYQSRNVREEIGRAAAAQLRAERAGAPPQARAEFARQIAASEALMREQAEKKRSSKRRPRKPTKRTTA